MENCTLPIEKTLNIITDVLAKEFHPERIFLFGSQAWGTPSLQSDIDICVVLKESHLSKADRIRQGLVALMPYHINIDLLVFTEEEFMLRMDHPSTLAYQIVNKGKKIYEAA